MKTVVSIFTILWITLFVKISFASPLIWMLQSQGDGVQLSSSFLNHKKTEVLLTPIIATEWDCFVTEISNSSIGETRNLICMHKDNEGFFTSGVTLVATCIPDGNSTVSQAVFLKIGVFRTINGKLNYHYMDLTLICSKK
jgi:hypothetical protein